MRLAAAPAAPDRPFPLNTMILTRLRGRALPGGAFILRIACWSALGCGAGAAAAAIASLRIACESGLAASITPAPISRTSSTAAIPPATRVARRHGRIRSWGV
jgi:hypothetical protein